MAMRAFEGFALGSCSLAIVAACWLYARGLKVERPLAFRRWFRLLRAGRAARTVLEEAAQAARERKI